MRIRAFTCFVQGVVVSLALTLSGCGEPADQDEWKSVEAEDLMATCGMDPELLETVGPAINRPLVIVRYGKLCHEYYPEGSDATTRNLAWSTTKTLGALVTGMVAWETRDIPRTGRRTGTVADSDRVDHWLDDFRMNPDATLAHVLGMVGHNDDLGFGNKSYIYDTIGTMQINRLSDVLNLAIGQDPGRLGGDLEGFAREFLFDRLGMNHSTWSDGRRDKIFAYSWLTSARDMARVGMLINDYGMWEGERLVDREWVYRMTHPAFEDANTAYGYLTWLNSHQPGRGGISCAPAALHGKYPHGPTFESPDCGYGEGRSCDQDYDVGLWQASGMGGQYIIGMRGLDMVIAVQNLGAESPDGLWNLIRPAVVAGDPLYKNRSDEEFCQAYAGGSYAPDFKQEL